MKPEWKSGQSLSGLKVLTPQKRWTKSTISPNLNIKILHNELSGYESVTSGSATNNSETEEHLKIKKQVEGRR